PHALVVSRGDIECRNQLHRHGNIRIERIVVGTALPRRAGRRYAGARPRPAQALGHVTLVVVVLVRVAGKPLDLQVADVEELDRPADPLEDAVAADRGGMNDRAARPGERVERDVHACRRLRGGLEHEIEAYDFVARAEDRDRRAVPCAAEDRAPVRRADAQLTLRDLVAPFVRPDRADRRRCGLGNREHADEHQQCDTGHGGVHFVILSQRGRAFRFSTSHGRTAAGRSGDVTRVLPAETSRYRLAGDGLAPATVKKNVLPAPGSLSTQILPPWASTRHWEMYRPSPSPRRSFLPTCQKRSKMASSLSWSMPTPESRTEKRTSPPSSFTPTTTLAPWGLNLIAFVMRFPRT